MSDSTQVQRGGSQRSHKSIHEHLGDNRETEDVSERTAHAIEHVLAYSGAVLKREFRLRSTPDGEPVSSYKAS